MVEVNYLYSLKNLKLPRGDKIMEYYECPKCGAESVIRNKTGLEFPDYPEYEENCILCGYSDGW